MKSTYTLLHSGHLETLLQVSWFCGIYPVNSCQHYKLTVHCAIFFLPLLLYSDIATVVCTAVTYYLYVLLLDGSGLVEEIH